MSSIWVRDTSTETEQVRWYLPWSKGSSAWRRSSDSTCRRFLVSAIAPLAIFAYMVTLDVYIAIIFLVFAFLTLAVPAMFYRWNRDSSFSRRKAYGALGSDFLDSVQGLATLKSFGQSKSRGQALAQRVHHLYRSTMGVVAANGATSGASIFFMATGAAVALAVGAARVSGGEMELRPLLIVLMLGGRGVQADAQANQPLPPGNGRALFSAERL